jgi:hypothetical protein
MYNSQSTKSSVSVKGGVGFTGLLTIVFIALKLTGHINWSWLWVLSPLWISGLLGILFIAIFVFFIAWLNK